jgi:hypothetical protein
MRRLRRMDAIATISIPKHLLVRLLFILFSSRPSGSSYPRLVNIVTRSLEGRAFRLSGCGLRSLHTLEWVKIVSD